MREIRTSGSMSGDGKQSVAAWPKLPRPSSGLPEPPPRIVRFTESIPRLSRPVATAERREPYESSVSRTVPIDSHVPHRRTIYSDTHLTALQA
jgi:hypothetical protein